MQHPDLTLMIHESLQRDNEARASRPRLHDQLGPMSTFRALMGNGLIILGTRIKPAPRTRPIPATMPGMPLAASRTRA